MNSAYIRIPAAVLLAAALGAPLGAQSANRADSLYKAGQTALSRGDYQTAGSLLTRAKAANPKGPRAPQALYWTAFAMYRDGGDRSLASALATLDILSSEFPRHSVLRDARDLRVRVCGVLARQGDERCAAEISTAASRSTGSGGSSGGGGSASGGATSRCTPSGQGQQGCPDDDDDERLAALNALLQMDADRALPLLEKTLARRDPCSATLRRKAVFLVAQKQDTKAADILLSVVRTDPDGEVREQGVFWLGQLRDERAVTILEDILKTEKDDEVLDKAIFALSQHRSGRAASLLRDIAVRDNAPAKLREQAIFWLGQQKSAENADLLIGLYRKVSTEDLRDKIIFSLAQMRSPATDKWMMDLALDEKEDIESRKKALFWAGQNNSVSVAGLAALYERVANQEMREQVIFVLSQRREAPAVDKLMEIARSDKDREMRKKAMFWLSQSRDPRVLKFLEEVLNR